MPFNPDNANPVFDSDPIEHHQIEATSLALLHEWLAGYFNGDRHIVGGKAYIFPKAELAFQANPGKQPLNGVSIHVICTDQKTERKFYIPQAGNSKLWFFNKQEWAVIVRSALTGERADNHNDESLCRAVADLCYTILTTPLATLPLNRMGFQHIRADPAQPLASPEYKMRRLVVRAKLRCVEGGGGGEVGANEGLLAANGGLLAAP